MILELITTPFYVLLYPIYFLFKTIFDKNKSLMRKTLYILLDILVIFPIWCFFIYLSVYLADNFVLNRKAIVQVTGTGSMYPTYPKGTAATHEEQESEIVAEPLMLIYPNGLNISSKNYFTHELERGDIVSFINKEIVEETGSDMGFVKRIVGLPGEKVELRNGLVYINGNPIVEPYIAVPHSTFGGKFLAECKVMEVPADSYFVLGDNRKESNDSRFDVGFVHETEIDYVLTNEMQAGVWDKNWHDTSNDLNESTKIKLNAQELVKKINQRRAAGNVKPLAIDDRLNFSAVLRAKRIVATGDFSFDGDLSKYSTRQAMIDANYSNVTWGEIPIQGYYDENELIEYLFEFPDTEDFLLQTDFEDMGVGVFEGELNGCPTQLIVLHFGGYVPPNYDTNDIQGWEHLLDYLKDEKSSIENIKTYKEFYSKYKKDIDRILEIINLRIDRIDEALTVMKNNQWLNEQQQQYLEQDGSLADEQEKIAKLLNDL